MTKPSAQLKIWKGSFGRKYTDRNNLSFTRLQELYKNRYGITRQELNSLFLGKMKRSLSMLEVGVNAGNQLICLKKMGFKNLYGIEPQNYALGICKKRVKRINAFRGDAFGIPFKDQAFDLVFTSGVLSHISPKEIKKAIKEIYRCTRKYIWGMEGYSPRYAEVLYRGKKSLLWRADFVKLYLSTFSNLKLMEEKKLQYLDSDNIDTMFLLQKIDK